MNDYNSFERGAITIGRLRLFARAMLLLCLSVVLCWSGQYYINGLLIEAVLEHNVAGVEKALAQHADSNSVYAQSWGQAFAQHIGDGAVDTTYPMALLLACRQGDLAIAEILLSHGADPNHQDVYGISPLAEAAQSHHPEIVQVLLSHKATVNQASKAPDYPPMMTAGYTPLMFASMYCDLPSVKMLVNAGADVNAHVDYGHTPLTLAISGQADDKTRTETARYLLEKGANVNVIDGEGHSVLYTARHNQLSEIVRLLKLRGAKE